LTNSSRPRVEDYIVEVIRESGDYLLTIPTLPGCNAQGSTLEAAFEDLDVSLLEWTEDMTGRGHPIPKPDTPEDFAGTVVVRMPPRLHARLFAEARGQGVSMNQLAVSMLSESLGGMGVLQRAEERFEVLAREVRAAYGERP
jgi:antitoxin HicB